MPSLPAVPPRSQIARPAGCLPYLAILGAVPLLASCSTVGSMMSPYPEKFSCKNSDHGQCIHPEKAYADALAGAPSRSEQAVTNGIVSHSTSAAPAPARSGKPGTYAGYRDSVYRELRDLIEAPATPMLKPARTVRTLILPYADRSRPDRLYMPRYVYTVLDRPVWVVGGSLVGQPDQAQHGPVLAQVRDAPGSATTSEPAREGTLHALPAPNVGQQP